MPVLSASSVDYDRPTQELSEKCIAAMWTEKYQATIKIGLLQNPERNISLHTEERSITVLFIYEQLLAKLKLE
jgi:hypothetical protein